MVNVTMATSTTEFFGSPNVCLFELMTYENNDMVTLNVTFVEVL